MRLVFLLPAMLLANVLPAAQYYVLCDNRTGDVSSRQTVDSEQFSILMGPLPGPSSAAVWIEENCPAQRCNTRGLCVSASEPVEQREPPVRSSGWVFGNLKSTTVSETPGKGNAGGGSRTSIPGPNSHSPRPAEDSDSLSPLIQTATAAADACNFHGALAAADHMMNFDPEHPWLVANHARIRRLEERQRITEQTVWEASSALSAGELKRARGLAASAADSSVSCQTSAVAGLLDGIDLALHQKRVASNAARRQAAAALLPGLTSLARNLSGGQRNGSHPVTRTPSPSAVPGNTYDVDLCAFSIEYRNSHSIEPVCLCAGYQFDRQAFRCRR